MCKELESVGLPDPVFNNSTFILKTTVMSADRKQRNRANTRIGTAENFFSNQNLPIDTTKVADSDASNGNNNKKLPFEQFQSAYSDKGYNEPTVRNLNILYNNIDVDQIFGSTYISKVLNCAERTARNLMTKLREMNVVVAVTGQGKGMYRFRYESESNK